MVRRGFSAPRARTGPTPIFKRRAGFFATTISAGTDGQVIFNLTVRETGTVYAVKVSMRAHGVSMAGGDLQWLDCFITASDNIGTFSPDWSVLQERETNNGFYVGGLAAVIQDFSGVGDKLEDKFRFRRLVDENSQLILSCQSRVISGTTRAVIVYGSIEYIIRTR